MYSYGPLHMYEQRQDDQLEPIYSSSVSIRDVALKTYRKQWTIEKGGETGSGISVLIAGHDDHDDDFRLPSEFVDHFDFPRKSSLFYFILSIFICLFIGFYKFILFIYLCVKQLITHGEHVLSSRDIGRKRKRKCKKKKNTINGQPSWIGL